MNPIGFGKFHGFGNDYIVFEAGELSEISSLSDFAVKICNRHIGVGGDGIAILEKLSGEAADFSCRILNPDGSEAGFSGNGTRCAVAYLFYKNLWTAENLRLQTLSGVKNYRLLEQDENTFWFRAELGKPKFDLPTSEFSKQFGAQDSLPGKINLALSELGIVVNFTFVDVGNPVGCIFVEDFDAQDWREIGSRIETAPLFPHRTNVVFVKIIDRENVEIRIWERGAGETASSGTCSIAAAVVAAYTGKTRRKVSVHAPGGTTEAVWREDGEMLITGRADLVFCGEWLERI